MHTIKQQKVISPFLSAKLHFSCSLHTDSRYLRHCFATWPGLTTDFIRKYLPKSIATTKGHLRQLKQNIQSTKIKSSPPSASPILIPRVMTAQQARSNEVYFKPMQIIDKISINQNGRFPAASSKGNKYIMVVFVEDTNAILTACMKHRSKSELIWNYSSLQKYLCERGFAPSLVFLDNKCSTGLKIFMRGKKVNFQLVPPHYQQTNLAAKAIST